MYHEVSWMTKGRAANSYNCDASLCIITTKHKGQHTHTHTHTHTQTTGTNLFWNEELKCCVVGQWYCRASFMINFTWKFLGKFLCFPASDTCWSLCDDARWSRYWSLWGNWDQRLHCFNHGLLRTNKNDWLARSGSSEEAFWAWRKTIYASLTFWWALRLNRFCSSSPSS